MFELWWEDCTVWSSFWGHAASGKCLVLNRLPLNDRITKFYGPSLFRKCLFCLFSQKLLETLDLSVPLPQWCCHCRVKGPAVHCSVCCVHVSVMGRRQHPSELPATINQWRIIQLSCCTRRWSWCCREVNRSLQPFLFSFFFTPDSKKGTGEMDGSSSEIETLQIESEKKRHEMLQV